MYFVRRTSSTFGGFLLFGLAMIALIRLANALNIEPTVLTAQQIKHMVSGTTLVGKAAEVSIRIFFDVNGAFSLAVKRVGGSLPQREVSGSWYVEAEADLLCLSIAVGEGGRQCWIVRRGDTIELTSSKGFLASLDVPLRTVSFGVQEVGRKTEFTEALATPEVSGLPAINDFTTRQNRDIYGNDIVMPGGQIGIGGLDIDQCASQCERAATCVAFSIDRWTGTCYLKNDVATSILDVRSTIAVKKPRELPKVSQEEAQMKPVHRSRFRGDLLARRAMADFNACQASCKTDLSCVGFTFQTLSGQSENCNTFKMLNGFEADAIAESGFKFQSPHQ